MISRWYVITGSPSSGKTTIINSLYELGYAIVPEVARIVINEEMKKGRTLDEIRKDEVEFQKKVLKIKLEIEKKLPSDKIVFFDRGIPDSIAYLQLFGINPEEIVDICKNKKYRKIFMLEMLPFEKDYARIEDMKTTKRLHFLIRKAYEDLGYEIIDVPKISPEERIKLILSNL